MLDDENFVSAEDNEGKIKDIPTEAESQPEAIAEIKSESVENNFATSSDAPVETDVTAESESEQDSSEINENVGNPYVYVPQEEPVKEKQKKSVRAGHCFFISFICTVVGCVAVAVTLLFMLGYFDENENKNPALNSGVVQNGSETVVSGTVVKPGSDVTINVETDNVATAVYAKTNQSVVGIRVVTSSSYSPWASETYTVVGEGSGIVYSSDGTIVTNYHVIADALSTDGALNPGYEIRVYLDTSLKTYSLAELKGFDSTTDLAVLKVNITGLTPLSLADISKVEIGETAIAIGSPGGLEFMNSVSSGIVSGLNRNLQTDEGISYNLIQTTAAINPGNSGGALLNSQGELIGICVMKLVSTGYESMGFAISADTVQSIVTQILESGKVTRAALGVRISSNYTETEAQQYNLPAGAWVYSVTKGSAAEKAGIKSGDIIIGFNDSTISNFYDLKNALSKLKPGDSATVKVYRDGKNLTLTVVLDSQ